MGTAQSDSCIELAVMVIWSSMVFNIYRLEHEREVNPDISPANREALWWLATVPSPLQLFLHKHCFTSGCTMSPSQNFLYRGMTGHMAFFFP